MFGGDGDAVCFRNEHREADLSHSTRRSQVFVAQATADDNINATQLSNTGDDTRAKAMRLDGEGSRLVASWMASGLAQVVRSAIRESSSSSGAGCIGRQRRVSARSRLSSCPIYCTYCTYTL